MKKILFLHGFLGSEKDMKPFFIKGAKNTSLDLKNLLLKGNTIKDFGKNLEFYDLAIGYSFGGRVLSWLNEFYPDKFHKKIYISSRHTNYSDEELLGRSRLHQKLIEIVSSSVEDFYNFWEEMLLFTKHSQPDFRKKYQIQNELWTGKEIEFYLNNFFTIPFPELNKDTNSYYFCGEKDLKYSKEGENLARYFCVKKIKDVGHRLLFENPELFKLEIKKILMGEQ